jgi:hypothetical protein
MRLDFIPMNLSANMNEHSAGKAAPSPEVRI